MRSFILVFAKIKLLNARIPNTSVLKECSDSGTADSPTRAAFCGSGNALLILKMENSFLDFLSSALVPILRANVAAGAPRYVHCGLVGVSAVRALPDELVLAVGDNLDFACVAAFLAAVGLCVKLGVHNVIVDMFHNR